MSLTFLSLVFTLAYPISALVALICLISFLFFTYRISKRFKNAKWIPVPAVVHNSKITRDADDAGPIVYAPVIEYHYVFNSKNYQSSTISPDLYYAGSADHSFAERWVSMLPPGTNVTAFVDQNNPAVAVLFPEYRYGWAIGFGVTFAVFGACNLFLVALLYLAQWL